MMHGTNSGNRKYTAVGEFGKLHVYCIPVSSVAVRSKVLRCDSVVVDIFVCLVLPQ